MDLGQIVKIIKMLSMDSKLICEKIITLSLKSNCEKILHLRISQVYGKYMNKSRVIPMMNNELTSKNQITLFSKGKRISNFISAHYLLKIILFLLTKPQDGIFNIGEKNVSYLNLAKILIKENGNKVSKILYKKNNIITNQFYLNTKKLLNIYK